MKGGKSEPSLIEQGKQVKQELATLEAELAEIAHDSDDVRAFLDFIEAGERPLLR